VWGCTVEVEVRGTWLLGLIGCVRASSGRAPSVVDRCENPEDGSLASLEIDAERLRLVEVGGGSGGGSDFTSTRGLELGGDAVSGLRCVPRWTFGLAGVAGCVLTVRGGIVRPEPTPV
jgi:hypothetical protein